MPTARWLAACCFAAAVWSLDARTLSAATDSAGAAPGSSSSASELNNLGVRAAQEGRLEVAVGYLRRALRANPQDPVVLDNLSGILTDWARQLEQGGQAAKAERLLLEAAEHNPRNGMALALLGDLYYFKRSDFPQAVAFWRRAHGALSGAERRAMADRIAQAQRDQAIERDFVSSPTPHFDIRVQSRERIDLDAVGRLLEEAYGRLAGQLGGGPPTITVIIYPGRDLQRTYHNRDWAIGFYDGRLRLQGHEVETELAPALIGHELTHAFLHHAYGNNLPIWVHEGFAQLQEGSRPRSEQEAQVEEGVASGTLWVPLKWLDRRFAQPSSRDDVGRAYVQARLVVDTLVKRHGMERFRMFLQELATGGMVDEAYDRAFAPSRWVHTDRSVLQ